LGINKDLANGKYSAPEKIVSQELTPPPPAQLPPTLSSTILNQNVSVIEVNKNDVDTSSFFPPPPPPPLFGLNQIDKDEVNINRNEAHIYY